MKRKITVCFFFGLIAIIPLTSAQPIIRVEPSEFIFTRSAGSSATSSISSVFTPDPNAEHIPNEVIVKFQSDAFFGNPITVDGIVQTSTIEINLIFDELQVFEMRSVFGSTIGELGRFFVLKFASQEPMAIVLQKLQSVAQIASAEPNYAYRHELTPNDYDSTDQWGLAKIYSETAWDFVTGNQNVVIAVVDTGLDYDHSDLSDNIWINADEIADNGIDDDLNGRIDDDKGWNFFDDNNDPMDDHKHGTHVAGIIGAAGNNGIGVVGTMWSCRLMALKALGSDGEGLSSDIAVAITYAVDNGADVINLSLGDEAPSTTIQSAINYAINNGVFVVAAAGNDNTTTINFPAGYSNVMSVGATNPNDLRAYFSNHGSWVDVVAPGVSIRSTVPISFGNYANLNGTSMATPFVAGLAGLLISQNPLITVTEIETKILNSADQIEWQTGDQIGRINLAIATRPEHVIVFFNDGTQTLEISDVGLQSGDSWLTADPTTFSISADGSVETPISLSIATLQAGNYTDNLLISSNDPVSPQISIPITLTIENNEPRLISLTADLNPIPENQTTQITAIAADDDDHSLTFDWSADQGTIIGNGNTAIFTPPSVSETTNVVISVTVSDGFGGSDTTTLLVVVDPAIALSIELSSFTAIADGNGMRLKWRTESEINNVGFFISRKRIDETEFRQIAFAEGHGSTEIAHDYTFLDRTAKIGESYFYQIRALDRFGEIGTGKTVLIKFEIESFEIPDRSSLRQNFPNPFNPETWIAFDLAKTAIVEIEIYDVRGDLVRRIDLGEKSAASYTAKNRAIHWNGRNDLGEAVSSGVYTYVLKINGDLTDSKKMVIFR